jgi:phage-related protein
MKLRFYQTSSGQQPVQRYLDRLPIEEAAELCSVLAELAQYGPRVSTVDVRYIRNKLWEARVGQHRLFYTVAKGEIAVLLHAYKKQTQRAPKSEIDVALQRMAVVLRTHR